MSTLPFPQTRLSPTAADQLAFREWLTRLTNPSGPGFRLDRSRGARMLAPLVVQTELGRGSNRMLLDALKGGADHLPERLTVVAERILDCLDCSSTASRDLVGDLSRRVITPVDGEDLVKLSRHFSRSIELLAGIASMAAIASFAEPALQNIHDAVDEFFAISVTAIPHLGKREAAFAGYVKLLEQHKKAKTFFRAHFPDLTAAAQTPERIFAVAAMRSEYSRLMTHLVDTAQLIYRIALKNGA